MIRKILLVAVSGCLAYGAGAQSPNTPVSQMEKLDRGVIAIRTSSSQCFLSWRMLGTDDANTTFEILKNGKSQVKDIYATTSRLVAGTLSDKFQIVTFQDGVAIDTTQEISPWTYQYLPVKLDRPEGGSTASGSYTYTPNDCSVGDVDGDGQYEIFVKWDPSNSKDNSQDGYSGNVLIDCYKLDGTKLWRVDLGRNIRAGAHYTQFMVYDFDGDGRAEMMCKTAPGSKDNEGTFVNQVATLDAIKTADNSKVWLSSSGRMDGGQEYLTVFNGLTGKAVHTIAYNPNRNTTSVLSEAAGTFNWAVGKTDNHGYNRGDRYLACVAYLDGPAKNPSGVFCRGYYSYAYLWAVDFDGTQLKPRWLHRSDSNSKYSVVDYTSSEASVKTDYTPAAATGKSSGSRTMFGNGNHNLSVADVDGDGKDEILWGSAALDDDGKMLYATGYGHGDAIHLGDLNPDRPGLELFEVHEEKGDFAWDVHDAATGEILWKGGQAGVDNGRGCAADIVGSSRGYEFWSAYGGMKTYDSNGSETTARNQNPFNVISGKQAGSQMPSMNFRIYWDGDAQDELLDGVTITKYNTTSSATTLGIGRTQLSSLNSPSSCNGTKATPCLQADILGDWREEVILFSTTDNATLNIYSTVTNTNYRVPTLMHDHVYRMGICWQNVAYNQPPHLGYYLPDYIESFQGNNPTSGIQEVVETGDAGNGKCYNLLGQRVSAPTRGIFFRGGKKFVGNGK